MDAILTDELSVVLCQINAKTILDKQEQMFDKIKEKILRSFFLY
jgi:hypothetical protein